MTAMEPKCLKMDLVEELLSIDETEINLLYIYDKAERESISLKEIEELLRKNGLK